MNLLKKGEVVSLLNFVGGSGVSLLNFDGAPKVSGSWFHFYTIPDLTK